MSQGCTLHHLACTAQPGWIQEWGKCLHLHMWGNGTSCEPECYTGSPEEHTDVTTEHQIQPERTET